MPKKVPFRVIYCVGWEDDYPPKDLEVWRETDSTRSANSMYPQPPGAVGCHGFCLLVSFTSGLSPFQVQSPFIKGWRSPRYSTAEHGAVSIPLLVVSLQLVCMCGMDMRLLCVRGLRSCI